MPRFLLAPFGSSGDVNPCLWLGRLLQARGHEVTVLTVPMFREMAERAGLEFVGVGDEEEYMKVLAHKDLWKPVAGTTLVFKLAVDALRPFFEEISARIKTSDTVIVAPFHLFAARAVREKYGVPLVTMHLQPAAMLSVHDQTLFLPGMEWMTRIPVWMKKFIFRTLPNPADMHVAKPLRRFCAEVGVTPPRRILPEWLHSPDGDLLLFPEWFAPRQSDWPTNALAAGFPLEDLSAQMPLPAKLDAFLQTGSKPVLFSPGTGNSQAREFFAAGLAACARLGLRALLGTRFPEQLPHPLPTFARQFDYVPFSEILPRVAALVHHGGIGTLSQGFAAGVPQLIMPMGHDQPDNALRAEKLSVARSLIQRRFTADNVTRVLRLMLNDPPIAEACRRVAERIRQDRPAETATRFLENVADAAWRRAHGE